MATVDKNLASGNNANTNLNNILSVAQGRNIIIYSTVFTNTTSSIITVSIYIYDGTDRLYETVKIPAGSGKALDIKKMRGVTLEGNQIVKIQATSSNSFNYKINGAERS